MSDRLDRSLARLEAKKKLINRIQESLDDSGELNDWECDFLENVKDQLVGNKRDSLTERQMETLEKIEYVRAEGRDAAWEEYRDY